METVLYNMLYVRITYNNTFFLCTLSVSDCVALPTVWDTVVGSDRCLKNQTSAHEVCSCSAKASSAIINSRAPQFCVDMAVLKPRSSEGCQFLFFFLKVSFECQNPLSEFDDHALVEKQPLRLYLAASPLGPR